jgi:hypothetical protein
MLKRYWGFLKGHPAHIAITVVLGTLLFGGLIAGAYAKLRAKVPQLPPAKV